MASRSRSGPAAATTLEASLDEEKDRLTKTITRWNEHRLDLFEISLPDERGHFYGVIRFFFQNGDREVVTKCIRVHSTATSLTVVEALAEKFGLDLTAEGAAHTLYEVHQNGEERKLYGEECPLLVQLNWAKGHRDGCFVFRTVSLAQQDSAPAPPPGSSVGRKDKKRRRRRFSGISSVEPGSAHKMADQSAEPGVLVGSLARSVFTRSVSNPEAVMRRQRHQKMVKRILSIRSREGGRPGSSGSVHIYAGSLAPEEPFKTLTVAKETTAEDVIRIALEEFGCVGGNPSQYTLVPMCVPVTSGRSLHLNIIGTSPSQRELGGKERPLEVLRAQRWDKKDSVTLFQLKKLGRQDAATEQEVDPGLLPRLLEVTPTGAELEAGMTIALSLERTILGSRRPSSPLPGKYVSLPAGDLRPQHCEISDIEGAFTVAPLDEGAEVFVNNKPVHRQAFLTQSSLLRLGSCTAFAFHDPFEASRMAAISHNTATPSSSNHHQNSSSHHQNSSNHHQNSSNHHQNSSNHPSSSLKAHKPSSSTSPQLRVRALSHNALEQEEGPADHASFLRSTLSVDQPSERPGDQLKGSTNLTSYNASVMSMPTIPPPSRPAHSSSRPAHSSSRPAHSKRRSPDSFLPGAEPRPSFLPACVSFHPTKEGPLLSHMILEVKLAALQFKLAPAFTLYMLARHHLSPHFQPGAHSSELRKHLVLMLKNSVSYMKKAIKDARNSTQALAFWMANASEFLHFLNLDPDLCLLASDYQQPLASIVQNCFKSFLACAAREMVAVVPAFFDDSEEADIEDSTHSDNEEGSLFSDLSRYNVGVSSGNGSVGGGTPHGTLTRGHPPSSATSSLGSRNSRRSRRQRPNLGDVMATLSSALGLLRRNCVNASLTMQVFSLLVQMLNTKILNRLLTDSTSCCLASGQRLSRRLGRMETWASQQGLELSTGRDLAQASQAAALLSGPKYAPEDLSRLPPLDALNSKQIETLLDHYLLAKEEPPLSPSLAHQLVMSARMKRDKLLVRDGRRITVEEETSNPASSFVLPEMGYLGQAVQGVPPGLEEYTKSFVSTGLCVVSFNQDSQSLWTHPSSVSTSLSSGSSCGDPAPCKDGSGSGHAHSCAEPKIAVLEMVKANGSLGISITGGKNAVSSHPDLGIFVKKLVAGGAAEKDGRLQSGDQLLRVDGHNLQGLTQDQAAHVLKNTEAVTTLTVAKLAAQFYKLMNIINMPSPRASRKPGLLEGAPHSGSSHALQPGRRLERDREGGRTAPEQDPPTQTGHAPQPTHAPEKWAKEDPQQWRACSLWDQQPPPGPASREGVPGKEGDGNAHNSFHLSGPAHQPPLEARGRLHAGPTGYPDPSQPVDASTYNFVSQEPQAQSSQPQPSSQQLPLPPGGGASQLNSYASCSMDVQHSSLTGNSLPHAMSVIAQYDPPRDEDQQRWARRPKDLHLDRQLTSLVGLRGSIQKEQEWIRILESRRQSEERSLQLMEREFCKRDLQVSVGGGGGGQAGDFPGYQQQQLVEELEGKRRQANSNLQQIEVELHSARTKLQAYQHQLKMIELSLEAEESERKFHKLRTSEFSDHHPEAAPVQEVEGGGKGRSYDLQRIGDGKEMSLGVTPCPPTSAQHHSSVSGYGSLTRSSKHTRQKSDSIFLDPAHYTEEGPPPNTSHIKEEGNAPVHYRSKSEGPGEFPTADQSKPPHQQSVSSAVRQPGVGGWDHQTPPPRPLKPTSSSESSALQPIVLHDQVQHFNLSPTSESDFVVFPRPPPPGVDWSGSHDNHQSSVNAVATEGSTDHAPSESLNPEPSSSNLKKWADLHTWKKPSDWPLKSHPHNSGGNHDNQAQVSTSQDVGVSPYSPRNPNQYNFVGDFPAKEDPTPRSTHSELQFRSPPMASQEVTSSQVTNYQDDMPSLESYLMHNRLVSPATQDSQDGLNNVRNRATRDNTRVYPFAYTAKDQLAASYQRDTALPQATVHDIASPRVLPVTTRNRLQPQFSHHGNQRTHAKRDRTKLSPGNLTAVSRTEL